MAESESKGTDVLFYIPRRQILVGGQRHAPAALSSGKIPAIYRTEGCVSSRAGLDKCG